MLSKLLGASGDVMVCKINKQTCTREFESHRVPHPYRFEPHRSKKLYKLQIYRNVNASDGVMVSTLDKQTFTSEFESHWVPH